MKCQKKKKKKRKTFRIKSVMVWKKNLVANSSTVTNVSKPK